jgi:hypothetical protein
VLLEEVTNKEVDEGVVLLGIGKKIISLDVDISQK